MLGPVSLLVLSQLLTLEILALSISNFSLALLFLIQPNNNNNRERRRTSTHPMLDGQSSARPSLLPWAEWLF